MIGAVLLFLSGGITSRYYGKNLMIVLSVGVLLTFIVLAIVERSVTWGDLLLLVAEISALQAGYVCGSVFFHADANRQISSADDDAVRSLPEHSET